MKKVLFKIEILFKLVLLQTRFNPMHIYKAYWITWEDKAEFEKFSRYKVHQLAEDKDGNILFFADSSWMLNTMIQDYPS